MEWQPIESCPLNDSQKVDLWTESFDDDGKNNYSERYTSCTWSATRENWYNAKTDNVQSFNQSNGKPKRIATHWMPVPKSPKETA